MNAKSHLPKSDKTNFILPLLFILIFIFTFFENAAAQSTEENGVPNVFLDCNTRCYQTHIRSELSYLNFMRDRQNADVYIMFTSFGTGAGGREWTLHLTGYGRFEGMTDTLVFYSDANATDGQIQDLQAEKIQLALLPYILKTSLADKVFISIKSDAVAEQVEEKDPWDYWVFNVGGNFNFSGQEAYNDLRGRARTSVSRVTEMNKFNFSLNYNYTRKRFSLTDEELITKIKRFSAWSRHVHSISDHWSVGAFSYINVSTVENFDFLGYLRPAIEYNVYPYAEATRRQFTFFYNVGPGYINYTDTTIFNVEQEWLIRQELEISYRQLEEWGRLDMNIDYGNYMHDFNLLSLSFNPEIEWNVFRGFNLNMGFEVAMVRDQLNIRKDSASDEEVLLQLRQLGTDYLYYGYVGVNYRFGSKMNNIVNTRF